jgi:hypothetical protein
MTLVKEITALCHGYRSDLAFLTADHIGTFFLAQQAFPYSLYADGIYHDAWCSPQTWDCVRFPAWRNVTWSCNWAPITNLYYTRWAVLAHGAPVAISNGCFGDDAGLSDMDRDTAGQIAELWRIRTSREREKYAVVTDTRVR